MSMDIIIPISLCLYYRHRDIPISLCLYYRHRDIGIVCHRHRDIGNICHIMRNYTPMDASLKYTMGKREDANLNKQTTS